MGAKLCCLNNPNSEVQEPKKIKQNDLCSRNLENTTSPLQVHRTLKDILLASSNIRSGVMSPEFMINKDNLFSPRISMSSERLPAGDNVGREVGYFEAMSRSPSGILKRKRVTFRLPEEADIIIFYSPNSNKSFEQ